MIAVALVSIALLAGEPYDFVVRSDDGRVSAHFANPLDSGDKPCSIRVERDGGALWSAEFPLRLESALITNRGELAAFTETAGASARGVATFGLGSIAVVFDSHGAHVAHEDVPWDSLRPALIREHAQRRELLFVSTRAAANEGVDVLALPLDPPHAARRVAIQPAPGGLDARPKLVEFRAMPGTGQALLLWRAESYWQLDLRSPDLVSLTWSAREGLAASDVPILSASRDGFSISLAGRKCWQYDLPLVGGEPTRTLILAWSKQSERGTHELELREVGFEPLELAVEPNAQPRLATFDLDGRLTALDFGSGDVFTLDPATQRRSTHRRVFDPGDRSLFALVDGSVNEFDWNSGFGGRIELLDAGAAVRAPAPESGELGAGTRALRWSRHRAALVDEDGNDVWVTWSGPLERPWYKTLAAAQLATGEWLVQTWWARTRGYHNSGKPAAVRARWYSPSGALLGEYDPAAGRSGKWLVVPHVNGTRALVRRADRRHYRVPVSNWEQVGTRKVLARFCVSPDGRELWWYSIARGGVVKYALPEN
ncbi:MAG: hypothetical protein EPO68_01495 [Planctomycetota bacterium]|nr:MAG: hypothetical protein EPO68_01495 [Planctomycetota bacterium]